MPSSTDAHPDHSALFVLLHLAMMRLERPPRLLRFIIHAPRRQTERGRITLRLTEAEVERKRAAILAHESQMALSRKRFSAYASDQEIYYSAPLQEQFDTRHPVLGAVFERGALRLQLRLHGARANPAKATLLLALESVTGGSLRWMLPLPATSRCVPLQDVVTGGLVRMAAVRIDGRRVEVAIPIANLQPLSQVFVKLSRRVFLKDEAGWRQAPAVPLPVLAGVNEPRWWRCKAVLSKEVKRTLQPPLTTAEAQVKAANLHCPSHFGPDRKPFRRRFALRSDNGKCSPHRYRASRKWIGL